MVKRGKKDGKNSWKEDEKAPLYTIGVASRLLDCDPSVLRRYEKAGLVKPRRTDGNTRLYSRNDLNRLEEVHRLVAGEGLNGPGANMVMELRRDIERLENKVATLRAEVDTLKRQSQRGGKEPGAVPQGGKGRRRSS